MQQKTCQYCNTPAEPMATRCVSCGSALPVALPRPVAQMVAAQGRWRFGTTVGVTIGVSLLLGWVYGRFGTSGSFGWLAFLVLSWMIGVMPAMLAYSGWMNARRRIGRLMFYLLAAAGIWFFDIVLLFAVSTAFTP